MYVQKGSRSDTLEKTSAEMAEFYARSLQRTLENHQDLNLIYALLVWSTHSLRPLTLPETQNALKHDRGLQIPDIRQAVEGLCGSLLLVDHDDNVQLIHATARNFLVPQLESYDLALSSEACNERLALACLECIEGHLPPARSRALE